MYGSNVKYFVTVAFSSSPLLSYFYDVPIYDAILLLPHLQVVKLFLIIKFIKNKGKKRN